MFKLINKLERKDIICVFINIYVDNFWKNAHTQKNVNSDCQRAELRV